MPQHPPPFSDSLPADLAQFVRQQVEAGHYHNEAEVVTQGVRLLKQHESKVNELRQELQPALEGLDRGEGIDLPDDAAIVDYMEGVKQRGKARIAARRAGQ